MVRVVRTLMMLLVAVLIAAAPLLAAEKEKGEAKKKPLPGPFRVDKQVKLTPAQQFKLEAIAAELLPKHKELHAKKNAVLTPQQKAAEQEARKAAKEAGLKGKKEHEAVTTAMKLTTEQIAKLAAIEKQCKQLDDQIRQRVLALLTPEQRQLLEKKPKAPKEGKSPKGEKPPKKPKEGKKPKGPKQPKEPKGEKPPKKPERDK